MVDTILVAEIDSLLKQKLPSKSVMSGAQLIWAPPENTQSLPLVMSNVYRIRIPKFNGFLSRSKGGTGMFMVFTLSADQEFICEAFAAIRSLRILLNGVEIHNNQRFDHSYAEWLKKKPIQWLNFDGSELGLSPYYEALEPQGKQNAGAGQFYQNFIVPFPDNYSILTNKDHAFPLKDTDIYIEFYLNNANLFMGDASDGTNVTNPTISNFGVYLPISNVDPDVSNAVSAKLLMGDERDEDMMLIAVEDVSTSQQTYDFGNPGSKTFIWNNVSSSVRFLEAKLSLEPTGAQAYKVSTAANPLVYQFQYIVDGKNVGAQNPITVPTNPTNGGVAPKFGAGSFNLGYALYQDLVSSYNQTANDTQDMASFSKAVYLGNQTATATTQAGSIVYQQYPAFDKALSTNFIMPCNLDTVSRDLIGGVKLINNLSLQIWYDGNPDSTGTPVYQSAPLNALLIQHSNRIIAFSHSKAKVLK